MNTEVPALYDPNEPRSVVNLVAPKIAEAFQSAFARRPDLFGLDDRELHKKLKLEESTPTATDNRLRLKFWAEFDRAQENHDTMKVMNIIKGVCSAEVLYRYIKHPEKVSWLLTPPTSYEVTLEEGLNYGMEQMRKILDLPEELPNGTINTKVLELKIKVTAMFEMRLKGGITQKVENKNLNVSVATTDKAVAAALASGSMEDLNKRIKELESRERRALNLPQPKDKEVIDV